MKLYKYFVLLLVALVICETFASAANESEKDADKKAAGKKRSKKVKKPQQVRRTIRIKEAEPAPAMTKDAEPNEQKPTVQNMDLSNVGPTNQVEVKPNIEISQPKVAEPAPKEPVSPKETLSPVPYKAQDDDAEEEEEEEPKKLDIVPSAQPEQQQQQQKVVPVHPPAQEVAHKLQLANNLGNLQTHLGMNSGNTFEHLLAHSGNQHLNLAHGNNNLKQNVVKNSGNTETVHIEGVGNHRTTKISNSGNQEEGETTTRVKAAAPIEQAQPQQQQQQQRQQQPFVQINMNGLGSAQPIAVQPFNGQYQQPFFQWLSPMTGPVAETAVQHPDSGSEQLAPALMNHLSAKQVSQKAFYPNGLFQWPYAPQITTAYSPYPVMPQPMAMVMPQLPYNYYYQQSVEDLNTLKRVHRRQVKRLKRELKKLRKEQKKKKPERAIIHLEDRPQVEQPKVVVVEKEPVVKYSTTTTKRPTTTRTPTTKEPEEEIEWETIRVPKRKTKAEKN